MDGVDAMGEAMNIIRMDEAGSIAAMSGLEGNMTRKNASRRSWPNRARGSSSDLQPPASNLPAHEPHRFNEKRIGVDAIKPYGFKHVSVRRMPQCTDQCLKLMLTRDTPKQHFTPRDATTWIVQPAYARPLGHTHHEGPLPEASLRVLHLLR